jgi:hypothetical protein
MSLEDEVMEVVREGRNRGADLASATTADDDVVIAGWIDGVQEALKLLAREVEALKREP